MRMVRALRAELGAEQGTVSWVAISSAMGWSRCVAGSAKPTSTTGIHPGCPPRSPRGSKHLSRKLRNQARQ